MQTRIAPAMLAVLLAAQSAFAQSRLYTLDVRYMAVLDSSTLQQLALVDLNAVGNPAGIAIAGNGSRAYIGLGGATPPFSTPGAAGPQTKVAVIDLLTYSVLRTIDVGGLPAEPVASPSGDRIYVNVPASNAIVVIRTTDDAVIGTIPGSFGPLTVSPDGTKLYSGMTVSGTQSLVTIDTATFAVSPFASSTVPCFTGITLTPDGSRLYISGACPPAGGGGLREFDAATGSELANIPTRAASLAMTPDGSKLLLSPTFDTNGVHAPTLILDAQTLTQIGSVTPSGLYIAADPTVNRAYTYGFWGNVSPNFGTIQVTSIDLATSSRVNNVTIGLLQARGFAVAPVSPCGQFLVSPAYAGVTTSGGSGSFSAPVPAGCPWSVTSTDPWLTITSATSGVGPATITFSAAPSSGPRTAELRINGQVLPVYETQPLVMIDSPVQGTHVTSGFQLAGWLADLAVGGPSSVRLNDSLLMHVWAYPADGSAPVLVTQTNATGSRPDVAAAFPFCCSGGFNVTVTGLKPGTYTFVVYLFSPYLKTFAAARTVTLTIDPRTFAVIDTLAPNASVTVPFRLGGWALDANAASGTGVDVVNVYAYPDSGGTPIFAGSAYYGLGRFDLVPYLGVQFVESGYGLAVDGLAPGGYTMVAYAHSTVTGGFTPAVVHVTVTGAAQPLEIESFGPQQGVSGLVANGWAIDSRAAGGTGVLAVQAWAYPVGGGAPIFFGSALMGIKRYDIGFIYGERFWTSGWQIVGTLPSGTYDVAFFALSATTGLFDNVRVRRITVP
jgi:hypothetical protein